MGKTLLSDFYRTLFRNMEPFLDETAVVDPDGRKTTFRGFIDAVGRMEALLKTGGALPGDRIALCLPRRMEYFAAHMACIRLGCSSVALDPSHPEARRREILEDCTPRMVVDEAFLSHMDDVEPIDEVAEVPDDFECLVIYTSGSTGRPKGVSMSRRIWTE